MQCLTVWGQWAVQLQLLPRTASLPGGSGRCNFSNARPHCLGAVGSATPAMHRLTALGQWAVKLPQCTTSLPGGSGQCNSNSCNALPHCPGAVGSGTPAMHCLTAWGQWAVELLQCTASLPWGQWAVQLLQCTASLPGGSGQCNSCNALPHWLGAVGSATPAIHCRTAGGQWAAQLLQRTAAMALGQWAVDLRQYTAALPGGSEQCSSCITLPHCLGAVDSATPAMHASLSGGSGQRNSCNALPHCLGAVGSGRWPPIGLAGGSEHPLGRTPRPPRAGAPGSLKKMAPHWPGRRLRMPPGQDSPSPPGRCARFSEEDGPPLAWQETPNTPWAGLPVPPGPVRPVL